jgi:hypothetical protein
VTASHHGSDHLFRIASRLLGMILFVGLLSIIAARPVAAQAVSDSELYRLGYQAYTQKDWLDASIYLQAYVLRSPARYRNEAAHRKQVDAALAYAETRIHEAFQCTAPVATSSSVSSYFAVMPNISGVWVFEPPVASTSYPLVCRGGGDMGFVYLPSLSSSSSPAQIHILFTPGAEGVGEARENVAILQPGQCAWLDRALAPDEPERIVIMEPLFNADAFLINWSANKVARPGPFLPYLSALQDSDSLQEFSVYNDGNGDFIATAISPETMTFPNTASDAPQLAEPEILGSEATPMPTPIPTTPPSAGAAASGAQVLFDDDPRNNLRGGEPYFCSGFASDCEFGNCKVNQRVVWGPYCRETSYPYIQPGTYRVTIDGTGSVKLGATDFGIQHDMFSFGSQMTTLPAQFTFCWPGLQDKGYGFETIAVARAAGASVSHIRIEYLSDACVSS